MRVGVTFENSTDPALLDAVAQMTVPTMIRLVVQPDTDLPKLRSIIQAIKARKPFPRVMLCVVDSSRVESLSDVAYLDAFECCYEELNDVLEDKDVWELGNEIGGGSSDPQHLEKALSAVRWFLAKEKNITGEMALTGYAVNGYLDYLGQIPEMIRSQIGWLLISDYPADGCLRPEILNWEKLQALFPKAKLGIGECGIPQHGDKVPHGTRTYDQSHVEICMDRFAGLRSPIPAFEMPLMWWYGSQQFIGKKATTPMLRKFISIAEAFVTAAQKRADLGDYVGTDPGVSDQTVEHFQMGKRTLPVVDKGPDTKATMLVFNRSTGNVELWKSGACVFWSDPKLENFGEWVEYIEKDFGAELDGGVPVAAPIEEAKHK